MKFLALQAFLGASALSGSYAEEVTQNLRHPKVKLEGVPAIPVNTDENNQVELEGESAVPVKTDENNQVGWFWDWGPTHFVTEDVCHLQGISGSCKRYHDEAPVTCCSMDGLKGQRRFDGECSGWLTHDQAKGFCEKNGMRLCEQGEDGLLNGCGSGCNYDYEEVWTAVECECTGYFCEKTLDEIFITMTHNSLALPYKVLASNQNFGLATQFKDGIRGFNLDLYMRNGNLWTYHSANVELPGYVPTSQINELISAMNDYPNEFVVVQLQDAMDIAGRDKLLNLFGTLVVKNFDISERLGHYIEKGQRVLFATDKGENVDPAIGMHDTEKVITENDYSWWGGDCEDDEPPMDIRRGPILGRSAMLMNHFCGSDFFGATPSEENSWYVNQKNRILYNARLFKKQWYTSNKINMILVDFYEFGDVFGAQRAIRAGQIDQDCWADGTECGGSDCWNCCASAYEFWWNKLSKACGYMPCWGSGTDCGSGTTCDFCCSGADCPWYKAGFCKCE